ncbi:MAG: hypothetical protein SOX72_07190 [Oscillospiraceae bacterium]|nr:hypothetical protein [Oscillospiraceae bacterium]
MTCKELLEEYLDRERNNVFCYSANYMMDTPKKGYEKEFAEAVERVDMLETLILANGHL